MFGKRLLDAAALLKASRAVVSKHLTYRRHRLGAYSRTSSLARALQNQTDRFTLTRRAAAAIAARFNGPVSEYSTQASQWKTAAQDDPVPSPASVEGAPKTNVDKQGLEQDHFYERSAENTTAKPLQELHLSVKQEQAKRDPLPDGSILQAGASSGLVAGEAEADSNAVLRRAPADHPLTPDQGSRSLTANHAKKLQRQAEKQIPSQAAEPPPPSSWDPSSSGASDKEAQQQELGVEQGQDVFYSPSPSAGKVLSALPRTKLPKATANVQESDPHVQDEHMNQDVFYSPTPNSGEAALPDAQTVPERNEISEDLYAEIFQSPKVARMIKGQSRQSQRSKGLDLKGAEDMPNEEKKSVDEKDHVTFSERETLPANRETPKEMGNKSRKPSEERPDEDDALELAKKMSKDAENATEVPLPSDRRLWQVY